jgi:hypothetical protein
VVTRVDHQDALTFDVELRQGEPAAAVLPGMVETIRDVMKLRGGVRVVPAGTIPEGARKIDDRRTWD